MDFIRRKKNLNEDFRSLKGIHVALLSDTASELVEQAIREWGYEYHLDLQIFRGGINQIDHQILNGSSELYEYAPDVVIIFQSSEQLLARFNELSFKEKEVYADRCVVHVEKIANKLIEKLQAKIIYLNLADIDDAIFGSFGNKLKSPFIYQQRKFNVYFMDLALKNPNLFICDLSTLQNRLRRK